MKKLIKRILSVILIAGVMTSCEDYLDVNTNPNQPTEVSLNLLMAHASYKTGNNIQLAGNITSYYVQYLASPNVNGSKDIHEAQPYDGTWQALYRMMGTISDLEVQAEEEGASHYLGAAKILKAINLGLTVDLWGDVPYSQAFFAEYLKPQYDDDEVLYDEIFALLDAGIVAFSAADQESILGDDDFVYGGGDDAAELWIKMAHTLKARYLLHTGASAATIFAELALGIQSNPENGDITFSSQGPDVYNPWANVARSQEALILDGWVSQQLADAMNGTTFGVVDPRLPFMFGETDDGSYIGVQNGEGRPSGTGVAGDFSTLVRGTYYASDDSPILIITLAEAKFIEAEVALAANDLPRAYQAYIDGIEAHMDMIGVDPGDAATYVANPAVSVGSANITRALIMKEKYVAMFLNPEAWNDARRFDYAYEDMTLPANHNPTLNGQFVRRLAYPDTETSRNLQNVPEVTILDRIWWDQ
jgi:hypothetical protein